MAGEATAPGREVRRTTTYDARAMNVTVRESVHIRAAPERVWDFTQDWTRRADWDPAIRAAEVLPGPTRAVRARTSAGTFLVRYKLFDRPHRTSLAMTTDRPGTFRGGGGSWEYAPEGDGTRFTQQNTLVLRPGMVAAYLRPFVRWQLARLTRKALANAKRILEAR